MKTFSFWTCLVCPLIAVHLVAASCGRLGEEETGRCGTLCVSFDPVGHFTRAGTPLPDTSDFRLSISNSKGNVIYDGYFGDCPEALDVSPGTYVVKAVSCEFSKPAFEMPQYGDEQCVVVPSGARVGVKLVCAQMNAGVSLSVSSDFLTLYPDGVLFLKSFSGKLMYSYSERRTAYFVPGDVSLIMSSNGVDQTVMIRELAARAMVNIKVGVSKQDGVSQGGVSMSIDTARVWSIDECVIGGGAESSDVLTVAQAMSAAGREEVWVSGYVVGGDLTSASASFELPFKSRTNLLLGPRSSTVDRGACISVQLPEGAVRDALNLVDNPGILCRKVRLKGDVVSSYFGITGLKNIREYEFM